MHQDTRRKTIKRYHSAGDLHELTFSCFERRPLLTNDDWRRRLSQMIDNAGREEQIQLVAFVFMPEHLHLLVYPRSTAPNIGRFLARIKQPFSKQIKEILLNSNRFLVKQLTVFERPGETCFRFWQEGPGFDRNINSPKAIMASIEYIHRNPVRRGFCERAVDWKWSSARWYLHEPPRQQDLDLPQIHGLPLGAIDG